MSIEHIPKNDWAAIGARLNNLGSFSSTDIPGGRCRACVETVLEERRSAEGWSHLEALTAALNAIEDQHTTDHNNKRYRASSKSPKDPLQSWPSPGDQE